MKTHFDNKKLNKIENETKILQTSTRQKTEFHELKYVIIIPWNSSQSHDGNIGLFLRHIYMMTYEEKAEYYLKNEKITYQIEE